MEELAQSVLVTVAEISIGIAGFSGILVAILMGNREAREDPGLRIALSALLLTCVFLLVMSFMPLILLATSIASSTVWLVSSALVGTAQAVVLLVRIRQTRLAGVRLGRSEVPARMIRISLACVVSAMVLHGINAGWLRTDWPYLTAVVLYLLFSFSIFVGMLWGIWTSDDPPPES